MRAMSWLQIVIVRLAYPESRQNKYSSFLHINEYAQEESVALNKYVQEESVALYISNSGGGEFLHTW